MTIFQRIMATVALAAVSLLFVGVSLDDDVVEAIGILGIAGFGFVVMVGILVGIWIA